MLSGVRDIYEFLGSGVLAPDAPLTIVEIGAHHGQDSYRLRRLFPNARIICFEPDPRNVYELKRAGVHKVVELVDAAVGDTDGTAEFTLSGGQHPEWKKDRRLANRAWTQSSSLKRPTGHLELFPWVKFSGTARVKVMRLDTFAAEAGLGAIDFVWADAQGAEDLVIAGGQRALARTRYLFTEVAPDRPLYEGQIGLDEIVRRLPGPWEVAARFQWDALLKNCGI